VPRKHGTLNIYRVPFNGDGHGHGISQSIWVNFRMFDDGRIEAPLKYDNDSKFSFCGGVHIRLGDVNNKSIAEFYSDPHQCGDGRPLISLGGGAVDTHVRWNLQTTPEVACKYAHLFIEPNHDHPATVPTPPPSGGGTTVTFFNGSQFDTLFIYRADAAQGVVINCNTMARFVGTLAKNKTWSATVPGGQQSHFWFQRVMDNGCDLRNNQFENSTVGVVGRNSTAFQNIQ
jgi:hypothetical protein